MSAELIGILSVGVALGGLVLALQSRTDKRLDAFDKRLDAFGAELRVLGQRVGGLEQRVARLEGLIEGLFRPSEAAEPAGD